MFDGGDLGYGYIPTQMAQICQTCMPLPVIHDVAHVFEDCGSQLPIFDFDVGLILPQSFYMLRAQEYAHINPNRYVMIQANVSVLRPMFCYRQPRSLV